MALREEGLGIGVQIIPRRAEMVVDHVEEDHQAKLVRALDQTLEVIRAAIGGIGRDRAERRHSPSCAGPGIRRSA